MMMNMMMLRRAKLWLRMLTHLTLGAGGLVAYLNWYGPRLPTQKIVLLVTREV
jgi:hypothetical protein